MKKITYILASLSLLSCFSCGKDFLDISPYDKKVVGNFYKTPDDAFQALVAAYDVLQWGDYDNIIMLSEVSSDDCFGGCGASDDQRYQVWDDFLDYGFFDPHVGTWKRYYTGIYRTNIFLKYVDNVDWGDQSELKNRYISECRFLRAYYYFDLVRLFGNVPLLTEILDVDELNVPQADPADVYKVIGEDLKFAIENMPSVPYQQIPTTEYGRITKWAAEALMGRVYLYYTGYYNQPDLVGVVTKPDVRDYIDDVINNSGYALIDTFPQLWIQALDKFVGEDNIETVFPIKYTIKGYGDANLQDGNRWETMIGLRNQTIVPYANGWGAATINSKLFLEWPKGDTRRDATIIAWDSLGIVYNQSDQREYTGYNWKKLLVIANPDGTNSTTAGGGNFMYDNPNDQPEIRFADVLLMGAELHLDDNLTLAQTYFDRIRDRAFLDNTHRITLTGDQAGKSIIMEERRWELACEGLRYWDLLRQGLDVAKAAIDCGDPYPVTFRPETKGLYSIPQSEIDLSDGVLLQNPGW
jgi:hypothetical protein